MSNFLNSCINTTSNKHTQLKIQSNNNPKHILQQPRFPSHKLKTTNTHCYKFWQQQSKISSTYTANNKYTYYQHVAFRTSWSKSNTTSSSCSTTRSSASTTRSFSSIEFSNLCSIISDIYVKQRLYKGWYS